MRGSPPKVAPLGLSHCLPASVFGPLVPSALRRLASIGWTRRACVTLLAVASGTERCRAQKTKPGEPQDRSRLVRAGDAPAALPALPAPAGLPLIDVDILFTAELDLAPLLPISSWRSVSTSCSAYRISAVSKASGTSLRPCERPH